MATIGTPVAKRHLSPFNSKTNRRGLSIETLFCPDDVADPFDTVEWELRTAAIKGEGGEVLFEQNDCEIPAAWSQLATNVVVSKYFYGEVGTPERETERPAAGPPRLPHDRRLGHRGRLLRHGRGRRALLPRAGLALPASARRRSIRRSGSTSACITSTASRGRCATGTGTRRAGDVVQPENPYEYPQGSACFIQSVQDNMEDIMELARSEAMLFKFGSRHGHRPLDAPLAPREALRRRQAVGPAVVHAGLRPDRGGGQERRQDPPGGQDAVAQGSGIPTSWSSSSARTARRRRSALLIEQGYEPQGGLRLGPVPEREPLGPRDRRLHAGGRGRQAVDDALGHRAEQGRADLSGPRDVHARWPRRPGAAAIRACSTTRRSTAGTPARTRGRINASNPCSRVHVPRRHGLQPGQHQPDEVPPRRRHVRRRAVPGGLPAGLHRPGNPGRSRQLSDASGSPRTATASGRSGWATRTWAA